MAWAGTGMRENGRVSELRAGPGLRMVRGLVAALVAGGLGLAAHVGAGGLLPAAPWLGVVFVALVAVAIASLGGPAGLMRVVALIAGGQFLTHVVLTASAGHAGDHSASASAASAASWREPSMTALDQGRRGSLYDLTMTQPGASAGSEFVAPHWLEHILDDLTGPHALMAIAHLAAAVLVACWFALGERALWRLIVVVGAAVFRSLGRAAPRRLTAAINAFRMGVAPQWRDRLQQPPAPLTGGFARRGPPLALI